MFYVFTSDFADFTDFWFVRFAGVTSSVQSVQSDVNKFLSEQRELYGSVASFRLVFGNIDTLGYEVVGCGR